MSDQIRQKKMDALAAKHLHVRLRKSLNWRNQLIDFLAIGVPILYFVVRYAAKGTEAQRSVELVWEGLAALLLFLTVMKITYHWEERAQQHSTLMSENLSLVRQADALLTEGHRATQDRIRAFLELADRIENDDLKALANATMTERQEAYRSGLKEFQPGGMSLCLVCNASPWHFMPGSCEACGNTPQPVTPNREG
jgi:mobilome CxxCx(11)CxxC protein